jgi:hypothetical protein
MGRIALALVMLAGAACTDPGPIVVPDGCPRASWDDRRGCVDVETGKIIQSACCGVSSRKVVPAE